MKADAFGFYNLKKENSKEGKWMRRRHHQRQRGQGGREHERRLQSGKGGNRQNRRMKEIEGDETEGGGG